MTVEKLIEKEMFQLLHEGENKVEAISKPFCCDLLSVAMSKAPAGAAWVTVMGNVNTLAVASLTECSCIILAEGAVLDEVAKNKAQQEGITVFATEEPIFDAAYKVAQCLELV